MSQSGGDLSPVTGNGTVPWWDWMNKPTVAEAVLTFVAWVWITFIACVTAQFTIDQWLFGHRTGIPALLILMVSITGWVIAGAVGWDRMDSGRGQSDG